MTSSQLLDGAASVSRKFPMGFKQIEGNLSPGSRSFIWTPLHASNPVDAIGGIAGVTVLNTEVKLVAECVVAPVRRVPP